MQLFCFCVKKYIFPMKSYIEKFSQSREICVRYSVSIYFSKFSNNVEDTTKKINFFFSKPEIYPVYETSTPIYYKHIHVT